MDPTEALSDLQTALPEWAARLHAIAATKFPDHGTGPVPAVNPGGPESSPSPIRKVERERIVERAERSENVVTKFESGSKKMNQKPGANKAKFSSITGPDIYYDGDSQKCFFDCWTSLNSKRGALRKEMMAIKRNRTLSLPSSGYGYDSDDELEADESEREETEEERMQKEEEERQRLQAEKKKQEDEKRTKLLESIDGCLDKAARACENAAYLWLKGEGCTGHIVFITQRMMEGVQHINAHMAENVKKLAASSSSKVEDEGFEEDSDEVDLVSAEGYVSGEEELPHKRAGDYHSRIPLSSPGPVEMAR